MATPPSEHDDLAQRPVVHVHDAPPGDAAGVDALLVAPVDVVVDQRREQVVRRGDGVEVAGEMQVHVLHRHDLRIAAAGRTALDAEIGPERGLADADDGLLADAVQPVAEPDRGGRLAFAGRRRVDRGDQDQLAVLAAAARGDELGRDLRLVMAIGQQMLGRNAELGADLLDRLLFAPRAISISDFTRPLGFPGNSVQALIAANVRGAVGVHRTPTARLSRRFKTAAQ